MKVSKVPGLGRFGIYIDDVDLMTISDEEWMEIGQLHMENLVTIVRNGNCTKDQFSELILKFGDTRYSIRPMLVKKYNMTWNELVDLVKIKSNLVDPVDAKGITSLLTTQEKTKNNKDVNRVTGGYDDNGHPKGLFADGELLWHSNESGTLTWVPGVALLAAENVVGSATGFVSTPDYYESVSNSFRSELDEMILIHTFTPGKINPGLSAGQDAVMNLNMCPIDAEVPMVARSPGGIQGLHYSINTVHSIKGMTKEESDAVFKEIDKNLFVEKYIYDHWYKNNNDLLMFDNSITMHRRLGNIDGRLCYRIAHDYTNLQTGVYQPYLQKEFQKRYNAEIKQIIELSGITNFKLPKTRLIDRIPFVRDHV